MGRSSFKWVIVFEDGTVRIVDASYLQDIVDNIEDDYSVITITRIGFSE